MKLKVEIITNPDTSTKVTKSLLKLLSKYESIFIKNIQYKTNK